MDAQPDLVRQVADAYRHLYDLVALRRHPLAEYVPGAGLSPHDRAWQLHHALLQLIEEISPGPRAPVTGREWRRYQVMSLHYVEGIDVDEVARRLSISRRHFYREHDETIELLAGLFAERYNVSALTSSAGGLPAGKDSAAAPPAGPALPLDPDRLALLRLEAARVARPGLQIPLQNILAGAAAVLGPRLSQRDVALTWVLPDALAERQLDSSLLRPILLGLLSFLLERTASAQVRLSSSLSAAGQVALLFEVEPADAVQPASPTEVNDRLASLADLATVSGIEVRPAWLGEQFIGFTVQLPVVSPPTVLVIDDNPDVLELFTRYLSLHGYRVVTARTAPEAFSAARAERPYAITLDLMMPGQDGWDVLQFLLHQPETRQVPIIVCSVLKERELALSLGATAFLEKPVTEDALASLLAELRRG